jgi:hypothetical protein
MLAVKLSPGILYPRKLRARDQTVLLRDQPLYEPHTAVRLKAILLMGGRNVRHLPQARLLAVVEDLERRLGVAS